VTDLELGMPLKHLRTPQDLVPEDLLYHREGLYCSFPKIGTKFDIHLLYLSLIHHANHHRSRTQLQINECENCPHPPSYVQLGTDSIDIVVLPSTGASCYHDDYKDGVASLEYFGFYLIHIDYRIIDKIFFSNCLSFE
jgi:hypothetical protein